MEPRIYTFAERPELGEQAERLNPLAWPEFMLNDPVADRYWNRLARDFPDFQFVLCDDDDHPVAYGNTIPFHWTGSLADLPDGWDAVLERGMREHDAGVAPNAMSALSATIHPDYQGQGLSPKIIGKMRAIAAAHGFASLVAPVRPNLKARYPLTSIERYAAWTDATGAPFDPWLRVHWRLGARQIALAVRSMVIPAPVTLWELWAGMRFPDSGQYIVPGALTPVNIDRETGQGLYVEPNVWMEHQVQS